jgi:hypothetical protein
LKTKKLSFSDFEYYFLAIDQLLPGCENPYFTYENLSKKNLWKIDPILSHSTGCQILYEDRNKKSVAGHQIYLNKNWSIFNRDVISVMRLSTKEVKSIFMDNADRIFEYEDTEYFSSKMDLLNAYSFPDTSLFRKQNYRFPGAQAFRLPDKSYLRPCMIYIQPKKSIFPTILNIEYVEMIEEFRRLFRLQKYCFDMNYKSFLTSFRNCAYDDFIFLHTDPNVGMNMARGDSMHVSSLAILLLEQKVIEAWLKEKTCAINEDLSFIENSILESTIDAPEWQKRHYTFFDRIKLIKNFKYQLETDFETINKAISSYDHIVNWAWEGKTISILMDSINKYLHTQKYYHLGTENQFRVKSKRNQEKIALLKSKIDLLDKKSTEYNNLSRQLFEIISIKNNHEMQKSNQKLQNIVLFLTFATVVLGILQMVPTPFIEKLLNYYWTP